jgi:hypothetical protein
MSETNKPSHRIFVVRSYEDDGAQKNRWTKIGVAFANKKGALNIERHPSPLARATSTSIDRHQVPLSITDAHRVLRSVSIKRAARWASSRCDFENAMGTLKQTHLLGSAVSWED